MPYIVMVGLTSDGDVYYADIDVPMNPKWIKSLSGVQDIAGSYGKLYTVTTGGSIPKYGPYDSTTQTDMTTSYTGNNPITRLTVDDTDKVAGLSAANYYLYSSSLTGPLTNPTGQMKSISMNGNEAYWIGLNGTLQYSSLPQNGTGADSNVVTIDTGIDWKQVSFDAGILCAIKNDGSLWYADKNVRSSSTGSISAANLTVDSPAGNVISSGSKALFRQADLPPGVGFNSICLKAGRLIGVGTDNKVYYSDTYSPTFWTTVQTQPYNINTGAVTDSPVTFSKVILMHPRLDARRRRFLGSSTSCNANEQLIGNFCYQSCPSGKPSNGTTCPYRARYINAIASCPTGDYINGGCYQPCTTGSVDPSNPEMCKGTSTNKDPSVPQASITPSTNTCPADGSVRGRYIRVRPTNLISNNKLCISQITVKDTAGNSLLTNATVTATDTKDITTNGCPIGASDCPLPGVAVYLSGTKYDGDIDGGKQNRIENLYWELDLGSIMNISQIDFVGCDYVAAGAAAATTSGTATGNPNSDQITGMTIEVMGAANHSTSAPITSRSLGPDIRQTIQFNYRNITLGDNSCYDDCPKINGMTSVLDPVNNVCISSKGGVTNRSVTVPIDIGPVSLGPALNVAGNSLSMAADTTSGSAVNYVNWVPDPSDSNYILSCDNLPGSVLKPISGTISIPTPKARPDSGIVGDYYNYYGNNNAADTAQYDYIVGINNGRGPETSDSYMVGTPQIGLEFQIPPSTYLAPMSIITDALNLINTCSGGNCNTYSYTWVQQDGTNYSNSATPYVCVKPSAINLCKPSAIDPNITPTYKDNLNTCRADPSAATSFNYAHAYLEAASLGVMIWKYSTYTRSLNSINTFTALNLSSALYSNPIVQEGVSIVKPRRIKATQRCLNADGSANTHAFAYNGRCMKCPSPNLVFYPKGSTDVVSWSQEIPGKALLGFTSYGDVSFYSADDAKQLCEAISDCNGVSGTPGTYTLRAGSNPANLDSTSFDPPSTSSWTKTRTGNATIMHGNYKNKTATSMQIPRAFADDYVGPAAASRPVSASTSSILDMYNTAAGALSNMMSSLGAAAAFDLYANSIQNPSNYYTLVGLERQISNSTTAGSSTDYGVCVGPCDSQHPIHDPIQLYNSTEDNLTVLYGTTCHEGTQITIDRPYISPTYTPQTGRNCPDGYILSGTQCVKECPYGTQDSGSQCSGISGKRLSTVPSYICPEGTNRLDSVCVYPCESGDVSDGEYCQPPQQVASLGSSSSIKCTKTAYGYLQGSGSGALSKWLCDSQDDLNALIGFSGSSSTGTTSYVNQNDIVCVADDPTTGMYYCQTVSEAMNQVSNSERTDMQSSCDNLVKAYYDLSNNLDILSSASTSATNASQKVAAIQMTLQSIRDSQCRGASGSSTLCNSLTTQLNALNTNINSGSGAIANVSTPIQLAVASRENLIAKMDQFQCNY